MHRSPRLFSKRWPTRLPAASRIFKVYSGVLKNDDHLLNMRTSTDERLAHIGVPMGKQIVPVPELHAGDIGVVAKLRDTAHGRHSRSEELRPIVYDPVQFRTVYRIRDLGEDRGTTKIAWVTRFTRSWKRIRRCAFTATRRRTSSCWPELAAAHRSDRQPFKEAVQRRCRTASAEDCLIERRFGAVRKCRAVIRSRPAVTANSAIAGFAWNLSTAAPGFEFGNEIFGGAIPRNLFRLSKRASSRRPPGYLAGFPVVDFKVTVYDGSYHDVDSSEMAFKLAARKAFKAAMAHASRHCWSRS